MYKVLRPYKFYNPKARYRPRCNPFTRSCKLKGSKRIPPRDNHGLYRPPYSSVFRAPLYEDAISHGQRGLLTIVIEVGKKDEDKGKSEYYDKSYNREAHENFGVREKHVNVKVVKSVAPKVHIKISRMEDKKDVQWVEDWDALRARLPDVHTRQAKRKDSSNVASFSSTRLRGI